MSKAPVVVLADDEDPAGRAPRRTSDRYVPPPPAAIVFEPHQRLLLSEGLGAVSYLHNNSRAGRAVGLREGYAQKVGGNWQRRARALLPERETAGLTPEVGEGAETRDQPPPLT